jgi:hypothetical protein
MILFDYKNPTHIRILKEELSRAKHLITEQMFSADEVWDKMPNQDRNEALYVAKVTNPDELIELMWDEIPADIQDVIDLSDYEIASKNKDGRVNIRGIEYAIKENPIGKQFIDKFLKKVGRTSLADITIDQSYKLNTAVWQYINSKSPQTKTYNPNNTGPMGGGDRGMSYPSKNPFNKGWTGD